MSENTLTADIVIDKLREFVMSHYEVADDDPDFNNEVNLFDYGYIDSFGAVELVGFVESEFDIKIPESDFIAYSLDTIRGIAEYVIAKI